MVRELSYERCGDHLLVLDTSTQSVEGGGQSTMQILYAMQKTSTEIPSVITNTKRSQCQSEEARAAEDLTIRPETFDVDRANFRMSDAMESC